VSDRPIRVLLDASAIVAFTRGNINVGEVIVEVADEGAAVGLPLLCLVEASRIVADADRLDLLVNHAASVVLAPYPSSWRALAITYETVGRLDAASAVIEAYDLDCDVLTVTPLLYAGLVDGGPIIEV
jgi:hypothetical protein